MNELVVFELFDCVDDAFDEECPGEYDDEDGDTNRDVNTDDDDDVKAKNRRGFTG